MATLRELDDRDLLFKLDPQLSYREQPDRFIYASPRLRAWVSGELPGLASQWDLETPPIEQFDTMVYEFCVGEELEVDRRFKKLKPLGRDIWELKTADLRVFGWFNFRDFFIGYAAEEKWKCLEIPGLVDKYVGEAAKFRAELDLDEPKCVTGENCDDVVSNWCYPAQTSRR